MGPLWFHLRLEATAHEHGTADILDLGEAVNALQGSVVGNGQAATNGGKHGSRDVGESRVTNEGEVLSNGGQVGERRILDEVEVEVDRVVDLAKLGSGERGSVGNRHLGNPLKSREFKVCSESVDGSLEAGADALKLGSELLQALVVVDVNVVDCNEVEAVQVLDTGVGNYNSRRLLDRGTQGRKGAESDPANRVDLAQLREPQVAQELVPLQRHLASDLLERGARQRHDLLVVDHGQVTLDLFRSIKLQSAVGLVSDDNISLQGLAAPQCASIAVRVDADGALAALVLGCGVRRWLDNFGNWMTDADPPSSTYPRPGSRPPEE